jgi:glycosyltransferase involved in cell wall biosynthesis
LAKSAHDFKILLGAGAAPELRKRLPEKVQILDGPGWTRNPYLRHLYQRYQLPKQLREWGTQVLFVPGGQTGTPSLVKSGIRRVVMLRNMLPFERRERERYAWRSYPALRFRLEMLSRSLLRVFRGSDRILFISRYSAAVAGAQVPGVDRRIIPHGLADMFFRSEAEISDRLRGLIRAPYVLYLSILDPYKHQDVVLCGFERFRQLSGDGFKNLKLVLAGPGRGAYANQVRSAIDKSFGRAMYLGDVPRHELPGLLRGAEALLFASTCETCPNILLEYLASGRPIISSNTPPMPEFGGDACEYVDATSAEAWAEALRALLGNPGRRAQLSSVTTARAELYRLDTCAEETLKALTEW